MLPQSRRPDGTLRPQVRPPRGPPRPPHAAAAFACAPRRAPRRPRALPATPRQVRVKKGYVPQEEQQTYDRWKGAAPAGVPGADAPSGGNGVHIPKPAPSKAAAKNAKRKAKKATETGAGRGG